MSDIRIKRFYDTPETADGWCVLVDRIWPRGCTNEDIACDLWAKERPPSTTLRHALHSGGLTPEAFAHSYRDELARVPPSPYSSRPSTRPWQQQRHPPHRSPPRPARSLRGAPADHHCLWSPRLRSGH